MANSKRSFIFYDDLLDALSRMTPDESHHFMMSIRDYRMGIAPEPFEDRYMQDKLELAISLISSADERYKAKCERLSQNFKSRKTKHESAYAPNVSGDPSPSDQSSQPIELEEIQHDDPPSDQPNRRQIPPELSDVVTYFLSRGSNPQEADKFHSFYESNGWRVGKNPMKDWQAAARNWLSSNNPYRNNGNNSKPATGYERKLASQQQLANAVASQCLGNMHAEQYQPAGTTEGDSITITL